MFSLELTNMIYIFHSGKKRLFRQFTAYFLPEKTLNSPFLSDINLRMYKGQIKLLMSHFDVTFELT